MHIHTRAAAAAAAYQDTEIPQLRKCVLVKGTSAKKKKKKTKAR